MIRDLYKLVLSPFFVVWSMQRTTDSFFNSRQKAGPESEIASIYPSCNSNTPYTRRLNTCRQPIGCIKGGSIEPIEPPLAYRPVTFLKCQVRPFTFKVQINKITRKYLTFNMRSKTDMKPWSTRKFCICLSKGSSKAYKKFFF